MAGSTINLPAKGSRFWKDAVQLSTDLPTGSVEGEARVVKDDNTPYIWNGVSWNPVSGGGASDSFNTIQTDAGTAPVATSPTDVLTLTSSDNSILITGDSGTDTVDFIVPGFADFVTDVTASAPLASSGGTTPNISIAQANGSTNGFLSSTDWSTFNNKQSALTFGNLTDAGTDGIIVTGGTGAVIGAGTSLSQHVADATHNGYLASADWSTFNNKFDLPALTAGSVIFSDGSTLAEDNLNFSWDNTDKTLHIGDQSLLSGDNHANIRNIRSTLDASGYAVDSGYSGYNAAIFTDDSTVAVLGLYSIVKTTVAAGKTIGGMAGLFSTTGRIEAGDDGAVPFIFGALTQHVSGNSLTKSTGVYAAYAAGFHSIDTSPNQITSMYDFYAQSSSIGAGAITNRYGIVIEPDSNYLKKNWLSGKTLVGGSSLSFGALAESVLNTQLFLTDPSSSSNAAYLSETQAHITADNTVTIYNEYNNAKVLIDSGITQNGGYSNVFNNIDRTDASDLGTLGLAVGNYNTFNQGSGAKSTGLYLGFLTGTHTISDGTVGDMYDFAALASSIGAGIVTNRYGIYLEADANYTKLNWISGKLQVGDVSFSAPTKELEVHGDASATGDIAAATMTPANGATGSFTTVDSKTVTVTNGIITAIV